MASKYITGGSNWHSLPRFETKAGHGSGAGYERWRSWEHRPHTPTRGKEDCYVPVHRLLAVVACYPEEMPVPDIVSHLDGKDVHHKSGVEWDNRPGNLAVREHGSHSAITQAQMRAWAEDDKHTARAIERGETPTDRCDGCGEPADALATSQDWTGQRCLECAAAESDGNPINL